MAQPRTPVAATSYQNTYQSAAASVAAVGIALALVFPGAAVGAVLAGILWNLTRTPWSIRILTSLASVGALAGEQRSLLFAWPWHIAYSMLTGYASPYPAVAIARSVAVEGLLGPTLLLIVVLSRLLSQHTLLGRAKTVHDEMTRKSKALRPGWRGPGPPPGSRGLDDPPGAIRLGVDQAGRVFDLQPSEIVQHIFIPGTAGFGKTTTLMRLANGALHCGYAVAIVDLKGGSLGISARQLARKRNVPFAYVGPDEPGSLGYDPCTGDPSHVANKLIGAFSYGPDAEIYKNIAMEVMPVICRAVQASGRDVTLDEVYDALGRNGLLKLARNASGRVKDRLMQLEESSGSIGAAGYSGLQHRIGALLEGRFGPVFEQRPALDWSAAAARPCVSYIALSVTAASEDVELFARVIVQDLKQLCDDRLRNPNSGVPLLVIFDEFAALREATQIVDLLLQAREARMPVVVATQFLPEDVRLRLPLLQSGVLIAHRLGADDSEKVANELGTQTIPFATAKVDFKTGLSEEGSVRNEDEYHVSPNVFRTLPVGMAVVYAKRTERRQIVRIKKDD